MENKKQWTLQAELELELGNLFTKGRSDVQTKNYPK